MDELRRRAQRAYEMGRWFGAFRSGAWTLVVAGASVIVKDVVPVVLLLAATALAVHVVMAWRHSDYLDGVYLAVALGALQAGASLFMVVIGMKYVPSICDEICFLFVLTGSVVVGVYGARLLAGAGRMKQIRAGTGFVLLGAAMVPLGCLPGAVGLILGSVFGVAAGAVPGWVFFRSRLART